MGRPVFKAPKTTTGDLHTWVDFKRSEPNDGPEPGPPTLSQLFGCFAQVYAPSNKDMTILADHETKRGVTIKIPDPQSEYIPDNKDVVIIDDYRYVDEDGQIAWNIVDVRPDFEDSKLIVIVLGAVTV